MNPHDAPTSGELVEAVREWLERDVLSGTTGRLQFHARVAVNVLAMVGRELDLGPAQAHQHGERLRELGFASDVELAAFIRHSDYDELGPRGDALRQAVFDSVVDKLLVANPKYLIADQG